MPLKIYTTWVGPNIRPYSISDNLIFDFKQQSSLSTNRQKHHDDFFATAIYGYSVDPDPSNLVNADPDPGHKITTFFKKSKIMLSMNLNLKD